MEEDLFVTMVQPDIVWERIDDNLSMYAGLLGSLKGKTDLVILPEMFTTGFSMNPAMHAEKPGGKTMQWMASLADEFRCVIAGSIIIEEKECFYNRLIWMRPDSSYSWYDKRHMFRMGNEHLSYTAGKNKLITELRGWNICPLICYDLRFPVWSKNRYSDSRWEYDALIYIANWPAVRSRAWSVLLSARAIENQAYVVGVNRVGTDGIDICYSGNSVAVSSTGNIIATCNEGQVTVKTVTLSRTDLMENRNKLQAGKDWDQFNIVI
jgi:omega-amidase